MRGEPCGHGRSRVRASGYPGPPAGWLLMVGGSCVVHYNTPPVLLHVTLLEKKPVCGEDVCPIYTPHLQPDQCAGVSQHGPKHLWICGDEGAEDEMFVQAQKMTLEFLCANMNNETENEQKARPPLPPWVPFVCVPPVTPQGITCSRPRTVLRAPHPVGTSGVVLGAMHQGCITRRHVRLRPGIRTLCYPARGGPR